MGLSYGSVCSGIESATVAWEPMGMQAKWFSEVEPFPCAVLAHHWPQVPNVGDMTHVPAYIRCGMIPAPDVLVGGTPCQAFSVAGKQGSLADARGGLSLIYGDILDAIDEKRGAGDEAVCLWENVPGVLNTSDNAFGFLLGLLAGEHTLADCLSGRAEPLEAQPGEDRQKWPKSGCVIGPRRTVAWRVLDAQYFGLAQRRKRVFVVASARAGFDPAAVLFEREGLRRDSAPSRKEGAAVANCITAGIGNGDRDAQTGNLITPIHDKATRHKGGGATRKSDGAGNGLGIGSPTDPMYTITCADKHSVFHAGVRRITPFESERLQGFTGTHTLVPFGAKKKIDEDAGAYLEAKLGRPLSEEEARSLVGDSARYKAIGNSKAVPVVRWLGARIIQEWYK